MTGQYAGSRFGQDSYPRISTSSDLLLEASAVLPYEPMYQSLLPFLPPSISSGTGGSTGGLLAAAGASDEPDSWSQYPNRLDLKSYQGDDVQIPLYITDPADPNADMSTAAGWEWKGQIRLWTQYYAPYVNEFSVTATLIAPTPPDTVNQTLVTLFLPRYHNQYAGVFAWDLFSTSPFVGPAFPPPQNVPVDEPWPPADQVKSWLYGYYYCVPRTSQTDWLPIPSNVIWTGMGVTVTPTGTYGPNGRVP